MSCRICGRSSCTESFHSAEQQEEFNQFSGMSESEMINTLVENNDEIKDLKLQVEKLEEWQEKAFDAYPNIDIDIETLTT